MKELESTNLRRATKGTLLCLSFVLLLPLCASAADAVWENNGTITEAPQVDATTFINSGSINIFTTLPFETANTRNYTNSGTLIGSSGWFFDTAAANSGVRTIADSFVNLNTGTIEALDGGTFFFIGGGLGGSISSPSYLWVTAQDIVNKGTMSVGGNGWMKLLGTNVNVSRSALEVTGVTPQGSFNDFNTTNFFPDVAIQDIWWGATLTTNILTINSGNVWNGLTATAPRHRVETRPNGGFFTTVGFSIAPTLVDSYTNVTDMVGVTITNIDGSTTDVQVPTNMVKQAVFVAVSDPAEISTAVRYVPSSVFGNPFKTVCVQIALSQPDVINGGSTLTTLYFYDTLAGETNRDLLVNITSPAPPPFVTERPSNYLLSRIDDGRFAAGQAGTGPPDAAFFGDLETFSSLVVTADYSGYRAFVDNLVSEPPPLASGTATNFPGRVQIFADKLDFRSTRVRGEGEVVIRANHLLSSSGAAVDCQNLSYELGSTNGDLNIVDLASTSVTRLKGNLTAWSGLWTNQMNWILTNNYVVTVDTNGATPVTNAIPAPLTNFVTVGMHALILDGSSLVIHLPVITWDLVARSTNTVVSDNLAVVQTLLIDGQSLTVNGGLALSNTTVRSTTGGAFNFALNNWVNTNSPNLLFFTNNGSLTVPSEAHFGDDRPIPYLDFINTGTLNGGSISVNSAFIANNGLFSASVGPLTLAGNNGLFQNGQSTSRGDIDFILADLKFNNHQLSARGVLNFTVTGGLSDAGPASGNVFRMQNGFNLLVKPSSGDLLGTTFQDQPPNFVEVDHLWAGEDRGVSSGGYANNTALGKLILTVQSTSAFNAPLFHFRGTGGQNALYVDLLDLTSLGSNYLSMIEIDPNMTIYYAAATLGFTPPPNSSGVPQQPEEFLEGQFGGRLRWVSSFAGPNSSVDVIINGITVPVNRALRFSKIIDSNGNGIPNFFDPNPFNSVPLRLTASVIPTNPPPRGAVGVSWNAAPQTIYQVEFTADVEHPAWQPLMRYTNTASANSTVTIWDTKAPAGAHRFYRVKTTR